MAKKTLDECRKGKEFLRYAETHGATSVMFGKGDHAVVYTEKGQCTIPVVHELGKGLRHVIIKTLVSIGITLILACVIYYTFA